ncbi:hypothetical protein DWB77_03285 [Streptomyces hundungensis]|uniref:Uncharacterized protein n=1 Tax=Streptomyces hundungensis TaxID=1077946 RepID=A0A387HFS6_9ACTN|nr:hypothetical protein DWB77_03285 [Streptomyces hundungensis]
MSSLYEYTRNRIDSLGLWLQQWHRKRNVSCRAVTGVGSHDRSVPIVAELPAARPHAVMSFVVKRAQAAEPKTATYRAWSSKFFTSWSQ